MKVLVIGAGQVGTAIVGALHEDHDVTVVDIDPERLEALSYRYDILTVAGNGSLAPVLREAGVHISDLVIAATDRDEANIVAAMVARPLSPGRVVVRTRSSEYVDAWRSGSIDVDHMVSSEAETSQAVARALGLPSAVQSDVFADGLVEMVEFIVDPIAGAALAGRTIAEAGVPDDCVVAAIIRGREVVIAGGTDRIEAHDRLVLIASHAAALDWAQRLSGGAEVDIRDVVVVGAGATGRRVAADLSRLGFAVRVVDRDRLRARRASELLPSVRVFQGDATDGAFLEREGIGRADAVVLCTDDDARDLLVALIARQLGARRTVAIVDRPELVPVFEQAGIDVALDARRVTAEEIVRFAHDPRARHLAMVEGDRAEVVELEVSATSPLLGRPFRERPLDGAIVGAIVRDSRVIYPRGDDSLAAGDLAVIVGETRKLRALEAML